MGRFKIKKADLFIDMTPMSDVMLLLLTFFLMAGTFTKPEPVQVQTPKSVSEIQIPSTDIMTIFLSAPNKDNPNAVPDIYINLDNAPLVNKLAEKIAANAPVAVRASKEAINVGGQVDMDSALKVEENLFALTFSTEDQKTGMNAFINKGKADFENK